MADEYDRSDFSKWKRPPSEWLRSLAVSQTPVTRASLRAIADLLEQQGSKLDRIRERCEAAQRHTEADDPYSVGQHHLADNILDVLERPK